MSKLKSTQHIEVELDMDELDLTDAEKKAIYQEIKDYVLEHTGLKVRSVFCQVLFPEKSVEIPCFRQGIFPTFGGH